MIVMNLTVAADSGSALLEAASHHDISVGMIALVGNSKHRGVERCDVPCFYQMLRVSTFQKVIGCIDGLYSKLLLMETSCC